MWWAWVGCADGWQDCCSRWWMTCHYVNEHNMYIMHAKVLDGLEAGGKQPSELRAAKQVRRTLH